MAFIQPQTMHYTEPRSPVFPEFKADDDKLRDINFLTAMEADHSRDLYLQGAMAVGEIARLLEELCAEVDDGEMADSLVGAPVKDGWNPQSLPYDKRCHIEAWVHAVEFADGLEDDANIQSETELDANETGEQRYVSGAFAVSDASALEVPEDLVHCIRDDDKHAKILQADLDEPSVTRSPKHIGGNHDFDLTQRMKDLTARLDKLEVDIDEFSRDTCDALARLDLELAAEIDDNVDDDIDPRLEFALHVFGFRLVPTFKEAS